MDRDALYERMLALGRNGVPCTLVVLVEALGSTPQDTGAKMLVTAGGLEAGTVGGGKVEAKAIELARNLLQQPSAPPRLVNWVLKRDVGMTCGGSVKLYFEPRGADGSGADWPIWIFGAGHVVQALVPLLTPLACQLTVVDPRRDKRMVRYRRHQIRAAIGWIGCRARREPATFCRRTPRIWCRRYRTMRLSSALPKATRVTGPCCNVPWRNGNFLLWE